MELMTVQEREKANKESLAKLRKIHESVNKTELDELKSQSTKTFTQLKYMIWITFLFGFVLVLASLILSLYMAFGGNVNGEVELPLGLGSLGIGDWITILLYKPMDRLQKANADFNETIMITASWVIAVNAFLLAMDVDKPDSLVQAAKDIQTATWRSLRDVQSIVQESSSTTEQKRATSSQPPPPSQSPKK
jgi:hypothetical protein